VGVGVCGSFMAARFFGLKPALGDAGILDQLPDGMATLRMDQIGEMLRPDIQALMPPGVRDFLRETILQGTRDVFLAVVFAALLCLLTCLLIPRRS
jgi:hypothetical protein